jgi:hypothetical protein
VPVAGIIREPHVMVANSTLPTMTIPEFIAYAKTKPQPLPTFTRGSLVFRSVADQELRQFMGKVGAHAPERRRILNIFNAASCPKLRKSLKGNSNLSPREAAVLPLNRVRLWRLLPNLVHLWRHAAIELCFTSLSLLDGLNTFQAAMSA